MNLQAIRERAEKATPGPWYATNSTIVAYGKCDTYSGQVLMPVAKTYQTLNCDSDGRLFEMQGTKEANADFIAHARTDILTLIDYIEKLHEILRD